MKVLNVTKLFTLRWLILCYVNFTSIKKNSRMLLKEIQEMLNITNAKTNKIPNYQNVRNLKIEKNLLTMRPESGLGSG